MARQTGRTTRMLTQAIMSDAKLVLIAAPTGPVIYHLRRMLITLIGKPDRVTDRQIVIGDKQYAFIIPRQEIIQRFFGIKDIDLYYDHTLFEDTFYTGEMADAYRELEVYVHLRKEQMKNETNSI